MIGCLRTRVRKQPIVAFYFEFQTVLKLYSLEARAQKSASCESLASFSLSTSMTLHPQSGKSVIMRESNCALGVYKEHYV